MSGEIKEECAVAAVSLPKPIADYPRGAAAFYLYHMLLQMQNRGQLAAGITTYNPNRMQLLDTRKKLGTVNEVFATNFKPKADAIMERYKGTKGIGHTRYSTTGGDDEGSAQPFERHHGRRWKWFSFAFNGNIANFVEIKAQLEKKQYHLTRNLDTEVMLHLLERSQIGNKKMELPEVFAHLSERFDGSYNIAYIDAEGTVAVMRDPMGIRPMCYAITDKFSGAASESVALDFLDAEIKALKPGEMFISKGDSVEIKKYANSPRNAHCMFEYVYFSNVTSVLDGRSVYETRWKLGVELAKKETLKVNEKDFVVVPVPDTAKPAADGYANQMGLPSMEGLIRNRGYTGRTFIESGNRAEKVEQKYNLNRSVLKDKKVILIDDSIVRGTTARFLIQHLRDVGRVKEIHMRVTCPPIRSPCFYGIDMSTMGELIANRHSNEEQLRRTGWVDLDESVVKKVADEIGVDSLQYMSMEGLVASIGLENGKKDMCAACVTGEYPTQWGQKLREKALERYKQKMETKRTYDSG